MSEQRRGYKVITIAEDMDKSVIIIGGGPAGLMAAEVIGARGVPVDVYDAMPSLGRKLLMAARAA